MRLNGNSEARVLLVKAAALSQQHIEVLDAQRQAAEADLEDSREDAENLNGLCTKLEKQLRDLSTTQCRSCGKYPPKKAGGNDGGIDGKGKGGYTSGGTGISGRGGAGYGGRGGGKGGVATEGRGGRGDGGHVDPDGDEGSGGVERVGGCESENGSEGSGSGGGGMHEQDWDDDSYHEQGGIEGWGNRGL